MEVKGVDISYCQEGISYKQMAAAGVKFAIIRAGFAEKEDRVFTYHVHGCQSAGIDIGYYWYSYANTVADARKEAKACLSVIKKYPTPKYPVFFDAEEDKIAKVNGREITTDIAIAFCEEIEKGGYPCGIYANPNWLETYYNKSRILGKIDIWLACWTKDPAKKTCYNYGQNMWQWGVTKIGNKNVDGDLCFIDYPARVKEWFAKHKQSESSAADAPSPKKSVDTLAREVIAGKWGSGANRKSRLTAAGYDYTAIQNKVNEILCPPKKSVETLAREVIAGKWGNGANRKKRLTDAGYDYSAVQAKVNQLLRK